MNTMDQNNEKPIIIIEEKPEVIPGQGKGEVPTITVERDDSTQPETTAPVRAKRRWPIALASALVSVLVCAAAVAGWRYYRMNDNLGIPVSNTSQQNIDSLKQVSNECFLPEVVKRTDSILGVAFNYYELRGLCAEISMQEPDTADQSVYFYCRSSDYHTEFSIIGSLVINGEEVPSIEVGNSRLGYFAAADGNFVIGVARDEEVKEYVKERGGSFFRQFILVSAGVIPRQFYLHGKVERRGIGRMPNGRHYFIESLHKESMWDFADALREYGFVDAIYNTGAHDYCYYRTADGTRHDILDPSKYPNEHSGQVPWLIFRKP